MDTRLKTVIRWVEISLASLKWISVYHRTPHQCQEAIQVLVKALEEPVLHQLTLLKWWWLAWLVVEEVPEECQECLEEAHQVALHLLEVNNKLDQQTPRHTQPSLATKMPTLEVKAMDYTIASPKKRNSWLSVILSARRDGQELVLSAIRIAPRTSRQWQSSARSPRDMVEELDHGISATTVRSGAFGGTLNALKDITLPKSSGVVVIAHMECKT